ncbi:MAG: flagellar biosynthesis protein FlgJ [Syntrophomonadaceae bacterium]|nr:flagellar biosynthesis protein FlgJ [Syntrophomonadaceae bacterium]
MKITDLNYIQMQPAASQLQASQAGLNSGKAKSALSGEEEKLMEACRDFEAIFLNELLKAMRKTVPKSDLVKSGFSQEVFQSMLDEEYSKLMATSQQSTGLAEMVFLQLQRNLTNPALED